MSDRATEVQTVRSSELPARAQERRHSKSLLKCSITFPTGKVRFFFFFGQPNKTLSKSRLPARGNLFLSKGPI